MYPLCSEGFALLSNYKWDKCHYLLLVILFYFYDKCVKWPPSDFKFHKRLKKQNVEAQNGDFFLSFFFIFLTTKLGIFFRKMCFHRFFFNCKKIYITTFKFQNNKQQQPSVQGWGKHSKLGMLIVKKLLIILHLH